MTKQQNDLQKNLDRYVKEQNENLDKFKSKSY
jgi:hypothetical protein